MKHVSLFELVRRTSQDMGPRHRRRSVHQRHHVLELIAISVGPARLIERGSSQQATRNALVEEPAVQEQIGRLIRSLDLDRAEKAIPVRPHAGKGRVNLR